MGVRSRISQRRKHLLHLVLTLVGGLLLVWSFAEWSWSQTSRAKALRIAAGRYLEMYGRPAPPYRTLPTGEVAHASVRWDASRGAYLIGFGHQHLKSDGPRDFLSGPIPYESGSTTTEFFWVRPDGVCQYAGIVEGGAY
jgi:hypothetical protein